MPWDAAAMPGSRLGWSWGLTGMGIQRVALRALDYDGLKTHPTLATRGLFRFSPNGSLPKMGQGGLSKPFSACRWARPRLHAASPRPSREPFTNFNPRNHFIT